MVMLWMDSVPSLALPGPEDGPQDDRPQQRCAGVGDMDVEVEEVRDPGPEDGDGVSQEPVGEGPVPASAELEDEGNEKQDELRPTASDISPRLQVVGGCSPPAVVKILTTQKTKMISGTLAATGAGKKRPRTGTRPSRGVPSVRELGDVPRWLVRLTS